MATPEPVKWLAALDAMNTLGISRTTLYRRNKSGQYQTETRNGRLFIAVPLEQLQQPTFHDDPPETRETTTETSGDGAILRAQLDAITSERDLLRSDVAYLREQLNTATEQVSRLSVAVTNEQALRMKALPSKAGWLRGLVRQIATLRV